MTAVQTEFSLRELVREMATDGPAETPSALSQRVLAAIPTEHLAAALAATLPHYVAVVTGEMRRHPLRVPRVKTPQNLSPKVQRAIQSNWERIRAGSINVGLNTYKRFGDCTYDDLIFAAQHRAELAARNQHWAGRYEKYAAMMAEQGAYTVDALDDMAKSVIESDHTP